MAISAPVWMLKTEKNWFRETSGQMIFWKCGKTDFRLSGGTGQRIVPDAWNARNAFAAEGIPLIPGTLQRTSLCCAGGISDCEREGLRVVICPISNELSRDIQMKFCPASWKMKGLILSVHIEVMKTGNEIMASKGR